MTSGWPTEDDRGMPPANRRHVPFGPEISWPGGYSDLEYPQGGYRSPSTWAQQPPAAGHGGHPYAAFNGPGYGDDGYTDPRYQGPAAQDAGMPGTPAVHGFTDGRQGHPSGGYAQSSYLPPAPAARHDQPGYARSSYAAGDMEVAYPPAANPAAYDANHPYNQPWDYGQPLRYDSGEYSYLNYGRGEAPGSQRHDGADRDQQPGYDPAAYNGSEYSVPGVSGPGYDLSGIIGTNDFDAVGYDEPSYGRLSYDDPRYDDVAQHRQSGHRFDETRFDLQRLDETGLNGLWQAGDDGGYGAGGGTDSRSRSVPPAGNHGRGARSAETRNDMRALAETGASTRFDMRALAEPGSDTRFDMRALAEPGSDTRFGVPRFDETRLDNLRELAPTTGLRVSGGHSRSSTGPRGWAEDTSLDRFSDFDLADQPVPAAYTRTLDRPSSRSPELGLVEDGDVAPRRAGGRRRGRSGDRRQWMALGAIAVVAAGAIGGVLMKYVFAGPSGPAHTVVAPQTVAADFSRSASLEKQLNVAGEAATVKQASSGQASDVVYGVYEQGKLTPGTSTQMFMFVGGKLAGADPSSSVADFAQRYPGTESVSPGSFGGREACTETTVNGQSASMCVWFDNDTFGTMMSPTMTTAKLASTMNTVRPSLEQPQS